MCYDILIKPNYYVAKLENCRRKEELMQTPLTDLILSFRSIAEQLPCVLIADEKGCYAYVNQGWCTMM